jgi:hypothetical protein
MNCLIKKIQSNKLKVCSLTERQHNQHSHNSKTNKQAKGS